MKGMEANDYSVKRLITKTLFDNGIIEKIRNIGHNLENRPAMILFTKSFYKDEEWINYLIHLIDTDEMIQNFNSRISKHFNSILTIATDSMDLISMVTFDDNEHIPSETEIERRISNLEEDLIPFFLSSKYLGRIKKQIDIFTNPFKNFFDFSVGFSFIRSSSEDDIISAISIAYSNAKLRKSSKFDKLSFELIRILDRKRIESYFQPIVDVREESIFAYEALARGPKGSPLRRPDILFKIAAYNGLELELDRLARRTHIRRFKEIWKENKDVLLTVNLGPFTPLFVDEADRDFKREGIPRESVIWEVSEKTYIDDFTAFSRVIDFLHSNNYRIAVDDFGTGAATFKLVFSIYTNVIKIDKSLVENADKDNALKEFLSKMIWCFYKPNNLIVAEGVETESEFKTLLSIGYRYYQGFFFFPPDPNPVKDIKRALNRLKDLYFESGKMYFPKYFSE